MPKSKLYRSWMSLLRQEVSNGQRTCLYVWVSLIDYLIWSTSI